MPISSIRPAHDKSGRSKKLHSTVLPSGHAPEPSAIFDGIVKTEPGSALMPKVRNGQIIVTLSNGKTKIYNYDQIIYFSANKAIKKQAKELAKMFDNVTVWNSMSKSVTHVVAYGSDKEKRRCNRTYKYICGIAQGCWIVSPEWIRNCLEQKTLLDEEHFEIVGDLDLVRSSERISDEASNHIFQDTSPNVPRISRLHKSRTSQAKSIFSDFMIKTVRPYDMNLTKVHLYELMRNTGATIVEDEKKLLKTSLTPIIVGNANQSTEVIF